MRDIMHKFKFKEDPVVVFAPESLMASILDMGFKTDLEEDLKVQTPWCL